MNPQQAQQIRFTLIGEWLKIHHAFPDTREIEKVVRYILDADKPNILPANFVDAAAKLNG